MAHTPGPWTISPCDDGYAEINGKNWSGLARVVVALEDATPEGDGFLGASPEGEANARLIAAAPAMLELLKRFLGCMEIQNSHLLDETSNLIADLEQRP